MTDKNPRTVFNNGFPLFKPDPAKEALHALDAERRAANAAMALKYANLHMPEDIRSRAKAWGMEAFCEVLWNNAFQAGFREALRPAVDSENE